jgi:hypothetical protein
MFDPNLVQNIFYLQYGGSSIYVHNLLVFATIVLQIFSIITWKINHLIIVLS